ncbi:hypothetical protein [Moraxella cuniculi]|uniref:Uncharacterized protein n=1 Tax=Moraxella cuniculi TaxID=34061 RepID=A0A448GZ02_9GAMM|nr:hypothetical protein [Moraxella cuniculi]VEG14023.1 Uncharacterised protein [Moraxella cuniculi]
MIQISKYAHRLVVKSDKTINLMVGATRQFVFAKQAAMDKFDELFAAWLWQLGCAADELSLGLGGIICFGAIYQAELPLGVA